MLKFFFDRWGAHSLVGYHDRRLETFFFFFPKPVPRTFLYLISSSPRSVQLLQSGYTSLLVLPLAGETKEGNRETGRKSIKRNQRDKRIKEGFSNGIKKRNFDFSLLCNLLICVSLMDFTDSLTTKVL